MAAMRHTIMLCLALFAACGGESDSSTADAAGSGSGSGADASSGVLPAPGVWRYAQYTTTQDSCGGSVDGDGNFTIELAAGGFRIVRASNQPVSTCTVDASADFECTTPDQTQDMRPATDAVLTAQFSLSGRITTPTLASGTQTVVVTCAGTECNDVTPGACTVMATVALAKQ